MSDPSHPLGPVSGDEQRMIRLFRCLDNGACSETLRRLGKRLMMEAAVNRSLPFSAQPDQAAREELYDKIDDRLTRLRPIHCHLLDLLDYDFDVTQEGWQEAGVHISEVLLGSGQNDDDFAAMLVDAYLEGANKYDAPLPCNFTDPEEARKRLSKPSARTSIKRH